MTDRGQDVMRSVSRKPGLQVWSVNKTTLVPVPTQSYGNFFEGDCYLVLHVSPDSMDLHYWIGRTSSQDEQGAAAILVTQMDEHLGGSPVQYREVQGSESPCFKSHFKKLVYKKGGVSSGFTHIEPNMYNILRLLHVKGRKHVTATEVEVSWNSFNNGDIFLLDLGKAIIQWNGPQSNRREKLQAVLLGQDIRDRERGGRAQIGVVEGGHEEDSPELMKIMRKVLGNRTAALKEATPDDTVDKQQMNNVRLYHVSDQSGKLLVQEVATQPLTQDLLHSSDCYILDQGGSGVMVWKGRQASREERRAALSRAVGFIKAKNYPSSTRVQVMAEGDESVMFKHLFSSWREKTPTPVPGPTSCLGNTAKAEQGMFDVMELHARPELAAQQRMVDDASGDIQVWRVKERELEEIQPSSYGQFYGDDCYLVLYTYKRSHQPQYIIYMWQGRYASQEKITACAQQAVAMDTKYGGAPVQVKVVMGKEPRHFLAIFKGKLIIFEGDAARPGVGHSDPHARLYQVRGSHEFNTKTTEVPARSSSLNTNDVFLLTTGHLCYLWYGKGCSGDERVVGKAVADLLTRQDKQVVTENQEPAEFWVLLGGKGPYASDKRLEQEEPTHRPRMFECSNQTGRFRMTEVSDFDQSDLDDSDVMLLDTWEELFLWIGRSSNASERIEASSRAGEYLKTHPANRDPNTPIISVTQGNEPPTFTGWFNAWDPHWRGSHSYEDMKKKLGDVAAISQITVNLNSPDPSPGSSEGGVSGGNPAPGGPVISPGTGSTSSRGTAGSNIAPDLLVNKNPADLPRGVDPQRREDYLSDADFEKLLGCTRSSYVHLPLWRQSNLKMKAGLL